MTSRSARTASTEPELSSQSASLKLWDVLFGYDGENVAMWRADFADFGAVDDKVNKASTLVHINHPPRRFGPDALTKLIIRRSQRCVGVYDLWLKVQDL